jgi:hypothetical protein
MFTMRDSRLLKQSHQAFTAEELIALDSCLYILFHGSPQESDYNPKILSKLIKDKLMKPDDLSQQDLVMLMAHYVIFHFEPIANMRWKAAPDSDEFRSHLHQVFT